MQREKSNSGVSHWLSDHLTTRKTGQRTDYAHVHELLFCELQSGKETEEKASLEKKKNELWKQYILYFTSGQPVLFRSLWFLTFFSLCSVVSLLCSLSHCFFLFSVLSVWKWKYCRCTCMALCLSVTVSDSNSMRWWQEVLHLKWLWCTSTHAYSGFIIRKLCKL